MATIAPNITVEIGLTTAPFASSTTWTDVTAYVDQHNYPITIDRGRSDAQSAAGPGTCTIVLVNDDKRFTPGYTGGTYGSNFIVGKRVRVTETHNGTDYRRFTGYISSMDMGWPGGVTQQNRVMVTATDILGVMAQFKLRNLFDHLMLLSDPIALWPLDDQGHVGVAHELSGYRNPGLRRVTYGGGGTCRFDDGESVPALPDKHSRAVRFKGDPDDPSWTALETTVDLQGSPTTVGLGVWVNYDNDRDDEVTHGIASLALSTHTLAIRVDGTTKRAFAALVTTGGTFSYFVYGRRISDGGWHHLYATYNESTFVLELFMDGVSIGTDTHGASPPTIGSTARVTIGANRDGDGDKMTYAPSNARMAYAGVWVDGSASGLDTDTIYAAGAENWGGGDRTSTRVTDVLNWLGVPSNRQDVERGLSTVAIGDLKDVNALDYVGQLVAAEQGFFFQKGNGDCTFQSRSHRWDTASECTLSAHTPSETFTTDLDQYVNSVEVSHRGGSVRVSDATSRATYGPRELSVDAALADADQAKGIADYVLKLRETMKPRMSDYTFDLLTEDTQATRDSVLSLELGDRFTVDSLPTQAHASSADFWIEGIRETISTHTWEVTFITTPYKDFTGFWQLGVTALDDPAVLAY